MAQEEQKAYYHAEPNTHAERWVSTGKVSEPDEADSQGGENDQVQQGILGDRLGNDLVGGQSITLDEDLA
jgi:hypothetical protein